VANALWDLRAKRAGLPLRRLLARMSPEELVALVDFRYLTDVLPHRRPGPPRRARRAGREEGPAGLDSAAVSGSMDDRVIEYVDHLHEHFVDPVVVRGVRYRPPTAPGFGATMRPETLAAYSYPDGPMWS
jgi:L-alanine-DL-glutamate epimerase-like enolase superfamily enzyme